MGTSGTTCLDVIKQALLNPAVSEGRYLRECPCCKRSGTAKISDYWIKCFYPACQLQPGINVNALATLLGVQLGGNYRLDRDLLAIRSEILSTIVDCARHSELPSSVLNWLSSRGITNLDSIGYLDYSKHGTGISFNSASKRNYYDLYLLEEQRFSDNFNERLIFPLHDCSGNVVHLMGRDVTGRSSSLRWLSTKTDSKCVLSNTNYLFGIDSIIPYKVVFLCEGITDAISLHEYNLPAAGFMGVSPNFTLYGRQLANKTLYVIGDSDQHSLGSGLKGSKSWPTLLRSLVKLHNSVIGNIDIRCVDWIASPGINDVNDARRLGWSKREILTTIENRSTPLIKKVVTSVLKEEASSDLIRELTIYSKEKTVAELASLGTNTLVKLLISQ